MALVKWNDSMSVGDPAIDRDQRMLIRDVNNMSRASGAGKQKQTINRITPFISDSCADDRVELGRAARSIIPTTIH